MALYDKASLVLIPSGTKEGVVFSQKPTNGDGDFTFTRASSATRVNSDGLIEKETQNLLTYSNDFNGADWSLTGLTATSGQADRNGGTDAWRLEATSAVVRLVQSNGTSGVQTFSIYAKAGNVDIIRFQTQNGGTDIFFDVNAGSIVSAPDPKIDATIEAAGNGFYRCTLTYNENLNEIRVLPQASPFSVSSGDFIYIQDAQLNQGLVADSYLETTTTAVYGGITDNIPRLDYTDASCPSLLLEPQRTNLLEQSEYFSSYSKVGTITVTSNYGVSPTGETNSTRVQFTSSNNALYIFSIHSGNTESNSIYVKGVNGETIKFGKGATVNAGTIFNLNGDWQRIQTQSTTGNQFTINTYSGATARDIEIFGAQIEEQSYATSYIPTYGASVTFESDSCSKIGISDLIGQTEGTLYAEFNYKGTTDTGVYERIIAIGDGSLSYRITLLLNISSKQIQIVVVNTTTQVAQIIGGVGIGSHKIAIAYADSDYAVYMDGSSIYTNNSISVPPCSNLYIGSRETGSGTEILGGEIKQALVFKTRLSNEELADLTTI